MVGWQPTFLGLRKSLEVFTGYAEFWPYSAGDLNGQGGWHDLGGFTSFWTVGTGSIAIDSGGTDAGSFKSIAYTGWDPSTPWTFYWIPQLTPTLTDPATALLQLGNPTTLANITCRVQTAFLGDGILNVNLTTETQSVSSGPISVTDGFPFLMWIQFDGTDLIYFLGGIEYCRITGALFTPLQRKVCLQGQATGGATASIGTLQLTQP